MAPSVLPAPPPPPSFSPFDHPQIFMAGSKRGFHALTAALEERRHFAAAADADDFGMFAIRTSSPVTTASSSSIGVAHQGPPKRKAAASATSELRQLREECALLQYELDSLQLKWRRLGVDSDLLAHACTAALEKRDANRSSAANEQLRAQTLEQQLFFAGLHQRVFYGSPLLQLLRAQDVFDGLHVSLVLPSPGAKRVAALNEHCESALRVAPALLSRFAQPHVDKASMAVPFSHLSVMGDASHTYVASVFVCKLRHQSLGRVFRAALAACEALPDELQRCLQVQMQLEDSGELKLEEEQDAGQLSRRSYSKARYSNEASGVHSTQNSLFAARLTEDRGVIASDFVECDEKEPRETSVSSLRPLATCMSLVVSVARDAGSGESLVLLQRVVVNRYALPATSRKLHDDVTSTMAHLNGDLLIAGVCRELQSAADA